MAIQLQNDTGNQSSSLLQRDVSQTSCAHRPIEIVCNMSATWMGEVEAHLTSDHQNYL